MGGRQANRRSVLLLTMADGLRQSVPLPARSSENLRLERREREPEMTCHICQVPPLTSVTLVMDNSWLRRNESRESNQ